jgi:two-component system cell cycle response regulator
MSTYQYLQVALVDDDSLFLEYLSGLLILHGNVSVRIFHNGEELIRGLLENTVDCIILDYDLGSDNGISVAEQTRSEVPDCPPIVMLTGGGSEKTAVKAFRNGFSDYVSKRNLSTGELLDAVGQAVERRYAERRAASKAAERQHYDPTTSLYTEEFIRHRLAEAMAMAGKRAPGFGIGVILYDQLPTLRAELGYQTSQRLLAHCAASLRRLLSPADLCGHISQDAFLLVSDGGAGEPALKTQLAMMARELARPTAIEGATVHLSPRVASAWFPRDGGTVDELVESALRAAAELEVRPAVADASSIIAVEIINQVPLAPSPSSAAVIPFQERRSERRVRALKRGRIINEGNHTAIDCMVRDLSSCGARLRLETPFAAPALFKLDIVGSGIIRRVALRWQIGREVGVEFLK